MGRLSSNKDGASKLAIVTFILVIITLALTVQSIRQASSAEDAANTTNGKIESLTKRIEQLELKTNPASPGGGVGQNVPQQPEGSDTGNTMPNASGQ